MSDTPETDLADYEWMHGFARYHGMLAHARIMERKGNEQHDRAEAYADALRDIARLCQGSGVGLRDDVMDVVVRCGISVGDEVPL
jgi:hypothetical protein